METKLTNVELMFAIKLQSLIENGIDINAFTKLAYLTGYCEAAAKNLTYKLRDKGILTLETIRGKYAKIKIELLVDPMTLINA